MSPSCSTSDASHSSEVGSLQCSSPPRAGGAAADWRTGAGAAAAQGPCLAHLRAERGQRRQVHGHVQELEQQKRLGLRRYPGLAQTLVDGGSDGRRGGCVRRPELAEEVAHWQVRDGAAIGQTVAFAIRHRSPVQAAGEFRQQPRLPHPRLPSDADHLPLPADRCASRACRSASSAAAHKATQGPCVAPWDARPPPPEPADRIHVHRGRGVSNVRASMPRPAPRPVPVCRWQR